MVKSIPPITSTGHNKGINIKSSWGFGRTSDGKQIVRYQSPSYEIRPFKKPTQKKPLQKITVMEMPEPTMDIFNENGSMVIIIDLPGVDAREINIKAENNVLSLDIEGRKKYSKKIDISPISDPASIVRTYNNGILSIEVNK